MPSSFEARNALVERYRFLPRHVAHTFRGHPGFRRAGREDLEQSGFVALIRAAAYFDQGKGATFLTYAFRAIHREIYLMLRSLPRTQRWGTESTCRPPCPRSRRVN
jgi:RNA polymerase sigma factor (sigma-70 family)